MKSWKLFQLSVCGTSLLIFLLVYKEGISILPCKYISASECLNIIESDTKNEDIQTNMVSHCPVSLIVPSKGDSALYEQLHENRSKNVINYYYAKHQRDGQIHDSVVILTPLDSDADGHLAQYTSNLCSLTYPHELISVVFGVGDNKTYRAAKEAAAKIEPFFKRVGIVHLNEVLTETPMKMNRHHIDFQVVRRQHLARCRNKLMHGGLHDEKWVLWMDLDLMFIPPDTLQQLIAVDKPIVVPSCLAFSKDGNLELYDMNTWKETDKSLKFLQGKGEEFVMLEGYHHSMRQFLNSFRQKGNTYVDLDGVGGTVLLILAECHRKGLIFPSVIYEHHLETEGLAKLARKMGFDIVGLPFLEVFHTRKDV